MRRQQEVTGAGQRLTHHSTEEPLPLRLGGSQPRRDNVKEFATTHPNVERHLRDHAAAAFP